MNVLISGGAGFIGTHLARRLLGRGHSVAILDNFNLQIHGGAREIAPDLRKEVRLVLGDVRDSLAWEEALPGQDAVVHLAAETGTGQSMYRIRHYTDVNIGGTSTMLELLLSGKYQAQSLIVASSRAVYGEGAYRCEADGTVYPVARQVVDMKSGFYEPKCPLCGQSCVMVPTPEKAPFRPTSLYGLSKQVQEQMILMYAGVLGINGFALRYQNVYGPNQSLNNPYTGILAIFSNLARANKPIYIFEDGEESRDFVYIDDVVEATCRALEAPRQSPVAVNVGTGVSVPVTRVVQKIVDYFGSESTVSTNGAFREGDIRHNCANIDRLHEVLDFQPSIQFDGGIERFLDWVTTQDVGRDAYERSLAEMREKGLLHG